MVVDTNAVVSALLWRAELIVSGDKGVLDIKSYQGIRIVRAAEALTRLIRLEGK